MVEKPESGNKLMHVIIPAATTILVAVIGLGTAIYQTEKPLQVTAAAQTAQSATLTAAPPASSFQVSPVDPAPTLVAQTVQAAMISTQAAQTLEARSPATQPAIATIAPSAVAQSITIFNKLNLSVKISIDNVDKGDVGPGIDQSFLLKSFPATVRWSVNKWTTLKGDPLGHDMSGTFTDFSSGDELDIDNVIDGQPFFYPIITNTTGTDCEVTINKGWKSEFVTHAVVPANASNVGMGYYKLYTNSNVTLECGADEWWWGQHTDTPDDPSIYDDVAKDTGVIYFTLKP